MPITNRLANAEVAAIVEASGLSHAEVAVAITRATGRPIKSYVIGRMISGERLVKSDEMDALRALAETPGLREAPARFTPQLTEHSEVVPLFSAAGGPGGKLRLGEEFRVGVSPIHPSQRGYRSAFNVIQPDDRLGDLVRKGYTAHVVRDLPPVPGLPCLVEKEDGEAIVRIYAGEDANTLFLKVLKPKEADERLPWREVKAVHRVTGVTFGAG